MTVTITQCIDLDLPTESAEVVIYITILRGQELQLSDELTTMVSYQPAWTELELSLESKTMASY